eukprot:313115-Prymnesium_polylepis.1
MATTEAVGVAVSAARAAALHKEKAAAALAAAPGASPNLSCERAARGVASARVKWAGAHTWARVTNGRALLLRGSRRQFNDLQVATSPPKRGRGR